jgi:hypothetical protein
MKTYWGVELYLQTFLNSRWVVSFTLRPFYTREKAPAPFG